MSRPTSRPWSVSLVLPLGVAVGIFVVAMGTTQVGMAVLNQREIGVLEEKARLVVDALADITVATLPATPEDVAQAILQSHVLQRSLVKQGVVLTWTVPEGRRERLLLGESSPEMLTAFEAMEGGSPGGFSFSLLNSRSQAVAAGSYSGAGGNFILAVSLDASQVIADRRRYQLWALTIDFLLAAAAALVAFLLTRRMMGPLRELSTRLSDQTDTSPRPDLRQAGAEIAQLNDAIEQRLRFEEERTAALADQSERERNAALAKLAAGLAHEVRNPLAGLLNAVSTLRRFGDQPKVREDTLNLIERGLRSIERVADAMLATWRPDPGRTHFLGDDLRDLRILVGPEARRCGTNLEWHAEEIAPLETDADALRQILLNLLINACKVSPRGGTVGLAATQDEEKTTFTISDSGPGMPDDVASFVSQPVHEPSRLKSKRLGLWVVSRLVEDIGGRIRVDSQAGSGTQVHVIVPRKHMEERTP